MHGRRVQCQTSATLQLRFTIVVHDMTEGATPSGSGTANTANTFDPRAEPRRRSSTLGGPSTRRSAGSHFPKVTGYRLLVIGLTAGFGLSKAKLSYQGQSTAPNTLDWLYGVIAFLL